MKKYKEYNVLTECKSSINAKDIKIFIYKMKVRDLNKKHIENFFLARELMNLNSNKFIVFYEEYIASFKEIKIFGKIKFEEVFNKKIDLNCSKEKKLLERLLLKDITENIDEKEYKAMRNSIYFNEEVYKGYGISIYRYIDFDVIIEDNGNVIVGFDMKHSFEYDDNLMSDKDIKKGDKVKDYINNITYRFVEWADFTIDENNKYLSGSIIDYYKNKNKENIIKGVPKNTKAVIVINNKNQEFPYSPNILKKVCNFDMLPLKAKPSIDLVIKLSTNDRMKFLINNFLEITKETKYLNLTKHNIIFDRLGYEVIDIKKPDLLFGNNKVEYKNLFGLNKYGVFKSKNIKTSYFVDPEILSVQKEKEEVKRFAKQIEDYSKKLGVAIERQRKNSEINFKSINIANENVFSYDLKNILEKYNKKETVIFILKDKNIKKYYEVIKNTFGFMGSIASQCISYSTVLKAESAEANSNFEKYIYYNILLGIYGKSGVQPWVLKEPLNSDCLIGLDISRENSINKTGIVQVVGKDGKLLKSKIISAFLEGEKIPKNIMRETVLEAIISFEKAYNKKPKHITFHRDGINREELEDIKEFLDSSKIKIEFDYVEITKDTNRRMATMKDEREENKSKKELEWKTIIGKSYIKGNTGLICTTESYSGMAKPIRIRRFYGSLDMKEIVNDVYKLTFMHIGALNKIRLPITTYYADLSATFGLRNLMPTDEETNLLHFI